MNFLLIHVYYALIPDTNLYRVWNHTPLGKAVTMAPSARDPSDVVPHGVLPGLSLFMDQKYGGWSIHSIWLSGFCVDRQVVQLWIRKDRRKRQRSRKVKEGRVGKQARAARQSLKKKVFERAIVPVTYRELIGHEGDCSSGARNEVLQGGEMELVFPFRAPEQERGIAGINTLIEVLVSRAGITIFLSNW